MAAEAAHGRLEIGHVGRAHGLRGEVNLVLTTDRLERAEPGAVLYAGSRRLVIESARGRTGRLIVGFEGVTSREAAEKLRGEVLHADPLVVEDDSDEDILWVHELVGAEVRDTAGMRLGTVASVEANPAHDLLVLDNGTLVPAVFVVEHGPGEVVVDPPAGLLDL
jgi:16S rRNA processing protein RimM